MRYEKRLRSWKMKTNKAECTLCNYQGVEKEFKKRNKQDEQMEYLCPVCGNYGTIKNIDK